MQREGMIVDREPATKVALLPNVHGKPTLHVFERAELSPSFDGDLGVALLYRCQETQELRQWGFEYTDKELGRALRVLQ